MDWLGGNGGMALVGGKGGRNGGAPPGDGPAAPPCMPVAGNGG